MKGLVIKKSKYPGIIMDVRFDDKGDIDRESFLVEVKDGKQVVKEVLPALGKKLLQEVREILREDRAKDPPSS